MATLRMNARRASGRSFFEAHLAGLSPVFSYVTAHYYYYYYYYYILFIQ